MSMARNPELIKLRDARIREVFFRMSSQRIGKRRRYTTEYIVYYISSKCAFVSPKVVEKVLFGSR